MAERWDGLRALAATLFPGAVLEAVEPLAADAAGGDAEKAIGYGEPLRVTVRAPDGTRRRFVFRTQRADVFGHDRRADRVEAALLSHELFNAIPAHVRALDVGVALEGGRFLSLAGTGEPYLVTEWAEGALYAEDLRRLARGDAAAPLDLTRADALAGYLAALHAEKLDDPAGWRRAVRDLVGHGEGIFGMVDGFLAGVAAAPPARLRAIEERCLAWRWRLQDRPARLARTHGDFHPFNIVFRPPAAGEDGSRFALLDASRGGKGDPADDVVALSVNYPFFALDHPGAWRALGPLWRRFWERYLSETGDRRGPRERPALPRLAGARARLAALLSAPVRRSPRRAPHARRARARRGEARPRVGGGALPGARAVTPGRKGGAVVWVTGLPASGKSTFGRRLRERLAALGRPAALLDGDDVRAALHPPPATTPQRGRVLRDARRSRAPPRRRRARRGRRGDREPPRLPRPRSRAAPRFVEVHLDVAAETCAARDPKGLWARARAGGAPELPGAGREYEPPSRRRSWRRAARTTPRSRRGRARGARVSWRAICEAGPAHTTGRGDVEQEANRGAFRFVPRPAGAALLSSPTWPSWIRSRSCGPPRPSTGFRRRRSPPRRTRSRSCSTRRGRGSCPAAASPRDTCTSSARARSGSSARGRRCSFSREGEVFGFTSLISGEATLDVMVEEDLLAYRLPKIEFEALLEHAAFAGHFASGLAERLRNSLERSQVASFQPDLGVPVATLLRSAPVRVPPTATVGEAARLMAGRCVSSALVDSVPPGIVTDRDFGRRVLAVGKGPETPVLEVASAPLRTVAAETPVYEAWRILLDAGVHHLPVTRGEEIVGVLSSTDLLRFTAAGPVAVMRSVERLASRDALPGYGARVAEMASSLFAGGLEPIVIGGFVARLNDRLLGRILRMAEADLGAPPTPYAWLAFGSEGRMEQTLLTDQDNALVYGEDSPAARAYFARFAERAIADLQAAGFPPAPAATWRPAGKGRSTSGATASTAGSRRRRPPRCSRRRSSSTSARCTATSTWPRSTRSRRAPAGPARSSPRWRRAPSPSARPAGSCSGSAGTRPGWISS